jgi:hypothetical protein
MHYGRRRRRLGIAVDLWAAVILGPSPARYREAI